MPKPGRRWTSGGHDERPEDFPVEVSNWIDLIMEENWNADLKCVHCGTVAEKGDEGGWFYDDAGRILCPGCRE